MEAIDKLREWSHRYDNAWIHEDGSIVFTSGGGYFSDGKKNYGESIREMINAIEREISERYMELPTDADGVPIRPREEVSTGVGDNGPIGHLEYWYPNHWVAVIEYKPGQFTRYDPAAIRHVKPRTLEDVLTDFAEAIEERGTEWVDVSQLASEIRELLSGDAE